MYETIIQDICFSFRRSFEKRAFTLQDENGAISSELLKLICDRFNQKRNQLCNVLCFTALWVFRNELYTNKESINRPNNFCSSKNPYWCNTCSLCAIDYFCLPWRNRSQRQRYERTCSLFVFLIGLYRVGLECNEPFKSVIDPLTHRNDQRRQRLRRGKGRSVLFLSVGAQRNRPFVCPCASRSDCITFTSPWKSPRKGVRFVFVEYGRMRDLSVLFVKGGAVSLLCKHQPIDIEHATITEDVRCRPTDVLILASYAILSPLTLDSTPLHSIQIRFRVISLLGHRQMAPRSVNTQLIFVSFPPRVVSS